jgi:hypothetical protein
MVLRRAACGLAVALAMAGIAQAQGYVTFYTTGPYSPGGEPAQLSMEVTGAPATSLEGALAKGQVFARQTLRVSDAVILDGAVKGAHDQLPPGTLLARVVHGRDVLWCNVLRKDPALYGDSFECLQDETGDGSFDRLWPARSLGRLLPLAPSGVVKGPALPNPVGYHPAEARDRPTVQVGLRLCDGDGVATPPRFALVMGRLGEVAEKWPYAGECILGYWPSYADKSRVDAGGVALTVTPSTGGALHYRVETVWPAGPIGPFPRFRPPIRPGAGAGPAAPSDALAPAGPPTLTPGALSVGQTLIVAPVRHALTGRLENAIRPGMMWKGDTPVEVGQPVFGIPLDEDHVAWCAPRLKGGVYETACLTPTEAWGYQWTPRRTLALLPLDSLFGSADSGPMSTGPTVTPGPIDLPAMTLSVRLNAITPPRKPGEPTGYVLGFLVDWGQGPQQFHEILYEPPPAGGVYRIAGLRVRLQPGPDPAQLSVQAAP